MADQGKEGAELHIPGIGADPQQPLQQQDNTGSSPALQQDNTGGSHCPAAG